MATSESTRALSEYIEEKENFDSELSQFFTPGRKPLKTVQENLVNIPDPASFTNNTVERNTLTPSTINLGKTKRKSKRLSIPVHVFRRSLKQANQFHSPLSFSSNLKKNKAFQISSDLKKSKTQVTRRRSVLPNNSTRTRSAVDHVIPDSKTSNKNEQLTDEKQLDAFAEGFVNSMLSSIQKECRRNDRDKQCPNRPKQEIQREQESNKRQNIEACEKKIQEFTEIILQMNKERLQLEKQLSTRKTHETTAQTSTKMAQKTPHKFKTTSTNQQLLQKELSMKTIEVQKLQKELQQAKLNKTSLESKKEEIRQLKVETNQLHHQVREVLSLKSELQKARQQVTHLNDVILTCRRENNSQKLLVTKLEKEVNSKEARTKQHLKECELLRKDLSQKEASINQLQELLFTSEEENRLYKLQCESLCPLVNRLEFVSDMAEKFKTTAHQKISALTHSLDEKTRLSKDIEEQLQRSRNESISLRDQCANLHHQISELSSEVDIGHLEISRQRGVIKSLEKELEKLKTENSMYQEHLELIQCQNLEMNMFLEEEKRTLQETAREMEIELVNTKQRGEKVEQLEEEVKFSRSLVMEKQEELDATQSQAHCIIQQLQNEITDAQEALVDLWDTLGPLLRRFREQAALPNDVEHKTQQVQENFSSSSIPGLSFVQSVLSAAAQGQQTKVDDDSFDEDNDRIVTLCSQIDDLKQGLTELAEIGYGQTASIEAKQRIDDLQQEKETIERQYTTTIEGLNGELATSRGNEKLLLCTVENQKAEIGNLRDSLHETTENFIRVKKENNSMDGLLEVKFQQREQILDLKQEIQRKEVEYKRLVSEKECIQEQLTEATRRMSDMCTTGSHDQGNLLEEKFMAERKLKEVKERWMEFRIKADDNLNEYKLTMSRKIMNLEKSLNLAESEVVRLDKVLEKIRVVLHKNHTVVNDSPSLLKVLQFLDGEESEHKPL